jgi:NADH:ubiquinone oxidoreductase subunit 3 (subunit A)
VLATFGAAATLLLGGTIAVAVVRWTSDAVTRAPLTAPERTPFAGGHAPEFHAWNRYHVRYYVMALLFLAFDMEMVYMYPWAVVFAREGAVAFVEMGMFLAILLLGVLYAWRERGLEWA